VHECVEVEVSFSRFYVRLFLIEARYHYGPSYRLIIMGRKSGSGLNVSVIAITARAPHYGLLFVICTLAAIFSYMARNCARWSARPLRVCGVLAQAPRVCLCFFTFPCGALEKQSASWCCLASGAVLTEERWRLSSSPTFLPFFLPSQNALWLFCAWRGVRGGVNGGEGGDGVRFIIMLAWRQGTHCPRNRQLLRIRYGTGVP
jgi:hypothetical protein